MRVGRYFSIAKVPLGSPEKLPKNGEDGVFIIGN
jgi:hypothetical protein